MDVKDFMMKEWSTVANKGRSESLFARAGVQLSVKPEPSSLTVNWTRSTSSMRWEAARRLRPYTWSRLRAAFDALEDRQVTSATVGESLRGLLIYPQIRHTSSGRKCGPSSLRHSIGTNIGRVSR